MQFDREPYAEELKAQINFKKCPDKVIFCMNSLKSALILYYRACKTSQSQDWFNACLAFKRFQFTFQGLTLWQKIKFSIRSWEINKFQNLIDETQK